MSYRHSHLTPLFGVKACSQYDAGPRVAMRRDALRNCEHCAKVNRVAPHRNAEERVNRPGFYSSVVTRGTTEQSTNKIAARDLHVSSIAGEWTRKS